MSESRQSSPRAKPTLAQWIVGGFIALVLLVSLPSSGVGGFLVLAGVTAVCFATYSVVSGRASWLRFASRKVAAGTLAGALAVMMFGTAVTAVTNPRPAGTETPVASSAEPADDERSADAAAEPSAEPDPNEVDFTDEAPVDPADPRTPGVPVSTVSDASATEGTALALLDTLEVKGRAPKTGYDRTGQFGSAWLDVDRNGCDTRNDMLARDLTGVTKSGPCKVMAGTLVSPYTGETVNFVRGNTTSTLVQIDHVVALSDAWQKGAQQLTLAQRISFANDPLNLFAVDGRSNAQKGAGDAATWLPANKSFRCTYVARQISVKATYGLWVTSAERDAMARVLSACPDEPAVTSAFAPAPVVAKPQPTPTPAPAPPAAKPEPAPAPPPPAAKPAPDVYYKNCTAAREAGAAPVHRGDPGYGKHLDRDNDGIGCE